MSGNAPRLGESKNEGNEDKIKEKKEVLITTLEHLKVLLSLAFSVI